MSVFEMSTFSFDNPKIRQDTLEAALNMIEAYLRKGGGANCD
jgi:hypothetical protein